MYIFINLVNIDNYQFNNVKDEKINIKIWQFKYPNKKTNINNIVISE